VPETIRSGQLGVSIQVAAQTAKTTLVRIIAAGGAGVADSTMSIDDPMHWLEVIQGPATVGPKASIIPDAPSGGAAYFETTPSISDGSSLVTRTTEALRKAESWGWSHSLSHIRKIIIGDLVADLWLSFPLPYGAAARSILLLPPPIQVWQGRVYVRNDIASTYLLEDLAWLLVHESLHHSLYSAGYAATPFYLYGRADLFQFWTHTDEDQHLATSLAAVVNASALGVQMDAKFKWPRVVGQDVPEIALDPTDQKYLGNLLPNPTLSLTAPPNLRTKSVVQPVPDSFGQRLDAMASIMASWGVGGWDAERQIGGWVDQFGPPLNYPDSGIQPTPEHLVLDLTQPNLFLAWDIARRAMQKTRDKWVEYRPELAASVEAFVGTRMGMIALLVRLGAFR